MVNRLEVIGIVHRFNWMRSKWSVDPNGARFDLKYTILCSAQLFKTLIELKCIENYADRMISFEKHWPLDFDVNWSGYWTCKTSTNILSHPIISQIAIFNIVTLNSVMIMIATGMFFYVPTHYNGTHFYFFCFDRQYQLILRFYSACVKR